MATDPDPKRETPPAPPAADDDLDDLYEEEPRRRPWGAIASIALALALVFVGYQWNQAVGRERLLTSQVSALRAEVEGFRTRAEEVQRESEGAQKRLAALAAEKEALNEKLVAMERRAPARVAKEDSKPAPVAQASAKKPVRGKVTPVAAKPSTEKKR